MRGVLRIGVLLAVLLGVMAAAETIPAPHASASPDILLARVWRDEFDPAAFWVSEKLDGVRAVWDGRQLRFRSGRPVHAPPWFVAELPAQPLDGELWLGGALEKSG